MNLQQKPILYAGLIHVIERGTAEILEETEDGIFLKDTVSGGYMLAVEDIDTGKEWLRKHSHLEYHLFVVFQKEFVDFIREEYGLPDLLECYQAAYISEEPPVCGNELQIRCATEEDLGIIMRYYHKLSEEELREIIGEGNLFLGFYKEKMVGFAGKHLEGSMGLLEIFPDCRRKGYGTELESFLIHHTIQQNFLPFCQVVVDNEESLALQKKLGMHVTEEKVYWVY